ncbi:MAG: Na+/H+ antiporter subunit E [Clostridium sp.]
MKKIKSILLKSIVLFIFWIGLTIQDISLSKINIQEVITGIVVSVIVAIITTAILIKEEGVVNKGFFIMSLRFIPIYFVELIKSNIDVAKRSICPKVNISPGIIKYNISLKSEVGINLLANTITLTPGTITLDLVEDSDKRSLYIHSIDAKCKEDIIGGIETSLESNIWRIFK